MRFRIKLRDPGTGELREVTVEAPTEKEALLSARERLRRDIEAQQDAAEADRERMVMQWSARHLASSGDQDQQAEEAATAATQLLAREPGDASMSLSDTIQDAVSNSKLFTCPDCGRYVSRRAESCPQCGCPITKADSKEMHPVAHSFPLRLKKSTPSPKTPPHSAISRGGSGKSIVLFLIGGALLVIALMMNADMDTIEKRDSNTNYAVGNLGGALTGRYEYKETKKQDRIGVYAAGGVGALFILGGIVTLSSTKK